MCTDAEHPQSEKPQDVVGLNSPSNNDKSKEEIYLELAKLAHESFAGRRVFEWKVAFGLWTGIGIFTYFVVQNPKTFEEVPLTVLAGTYIVIAAVWILVWQTNSRCACDTDKKWKHYYMHKAEGRDAEKSEKDPWCKTRPYWGRMKECWGKLSQGWVWTQSLPTIVFLLMSFAIIYSTKGDPPVQVNTQDKVSVTLSGSNLEKVVDKVVK